MAMTRRSRKLGMALLAVLVSATAIAVAFTATSSPSLNFNVAGVYYGGVLTNPGDVADFSVVLASSSSKSITLLGLSLVPLPGFATPKLVHVALLGRSRNHPAGTTGWPPRTNIGNDVYPTRSATGTRIVIGPGRLPILVYGVTGSRPGRLYGAAGVILRFRVDGVIETAEAFAGGFDCVQEFSRVATREQLRWCDRLFARADSAQWRLPAAKLISGR